MSVDSRLYSLWKEMQEPQQREEPADDPNDPPPDLSQQGEVRVAQGQVLTNQEKHQAAERDYWERQLRVAERQVRIARWSNGITVVAVVGGLVSLYFLKGTLDVTRISADAAKNSVEVAERTLDSTIKSDQLDQRAWVGVLGAFVSDVEVGARMTFGVAVINSGKTPA